MEYSPPLLLALCLTGFVAGGINTVAGGGSNLTLPLLMMLGLPADIANGTNRVAITMQSIVGVAGFDKHGVLDRAAVIPVLIPTVMGGFLGALGAAILPNIYLKPILLGTILTVSLIILIKPSVIAPSAGTPTRSPETHRGAWWGLFGAGVYGGFVQAGVGFILLTALAGGLRYDLLRANALKMVCVLSFTLAALFIFILFDQVWWVPGLILAVGSMAGAHVAVKFAIKASQNSIKWFLFVMTLVAVVASLMF